MMYACERVRACVCIYMMWINALYTNTHTHTPVIHSLNLNVQYFLILPAILSIITSLISPSSLLYFNLEILIRYTGPRGSSHGKLENLICSRKADKTKKQCLPSTKPLHCQINETEWLNKRTMEQTWKVPKSETSLINRLNTIHTYTDVACNLRFNEKLISSVKFCWQNIHTDTHTQL